ncbi:putative ATPase [Hymenobacter sp. UYAg731]
MNEQLVVKNFGPIKDATVDFKRVTVFIGPTGGGKSTLAKLAAILQGGQVKVINSIVTIDADLTQFNIGNYKNHDSFINWKKSSENNFTVDRPLSLEIEINDVLINAQGLDEFIDRMASGLSENPHIEAIMKKAFKEAAINQIAGEHFNANPSLINYIPTERVFVPAIEYSWAGLMRDDIGLPKAVLEFANDFSLSRKEVLELEIPFLNIRYLHINGRDFIKIPEREEPLMLLETASGIQSVTPLLVLLEHLSRNTEQVQSFIIEEPELNLYPTAQQGLLNWLVEKCTKGENDLTITTHSPYLLAHFNLLLYAYQVAENHPDRAEDVAKIVPRESWINPKEFAAYHVEGQKENGVRSIVNPETGLISYNGLDSTASAETAEFEKLLDINAGLEVE